MTGLEELNRLFNEMNDNLELCSFNLQLSQGHSNYADKELAICADELKDSELKLNGELDTIQEVRFALL